MTNRRNIFSRFFRLLVMLHKISYAHFTEWNNKRKRKAFAAGIYFLSILPEFVLLAGTFLAARVLSRKNGVFTIDRNRLSAS